MKYISCNIKGFEGLYHIYEDGTVYSLRNKRALKTQSNGQYYKYCKVFLTGHDTSKWFSVHRLVAIHFIGDPPTDKHEVNHLDMDKNNNHHTNLEWCTHAENIQKARKILGCWMSGRKAGFKQTESSKRKMSESKMKKVLLYNDNESLIFNSIQEFIDYFSTYRKLFNRYVNSHKTFNGFYVRYL